MEGLDLRELYAGGKLDSSGTFTLDLDRLSPKLGQFQLPSSEHAVLRFLACAVNGGASWFAFKKAGRGYVCSWDTAVAPDELDRLSELAIGVFAVRAHRGQIALFTSPEQGTRLEVRFPWTLLGRRDRRVLEARAGLAPLDLRGIPRRDAEVRGVLRTVQLGRAPLPMRCDVTRAGGPERGGGYLRLVKRGREELTFVIGGVRFPQKSGPVAGVSICWWTDELTLDLARERVVENDVYERLTRELAGEALEVLLERFLAGEDELRVADWLAAQAFGPLQERLRHVPLFPRADGSFATPEGLRAQFVRQGYLGISTGRFNLTSAWSSHEVLLVCKTLAAVQEHFPHRLNMTHLANLAAAPRLPSDQSYLTRIPMSHAVGELGLRRGPHEARLRRTEGKGRWVVDQSSPTSLDAAGGFESFKPALPHLYQALLNQKHPKEDASLVACYLLDCLAAFPANALAREALRIPRLNGQLLTLPEACQARFYGLGEPSAPDDVLLLSERAGQVLQGLAGADHGLRSYRSFLESTGQAETALLDCTTAGDLLRRLWDLPASAAGQYLRSLPQVARPKLPPQPVANVVQLAREMAHHSWIGVLSTDNLLRALLALQSPPGKKLLEVRGLELLLELDHEYADRPWFELHIMRARVHVSRRERKAAERECHAAAELAPDAPQPWYLLANACDLDGDLEGALEALAEMKRRSYDDLMAGACTGMHVDVLLRAGRLTELAVHLPGAFRHHSQEGSRHALLARVALARRRPDEALSHCAHAAGPDVHETRALALEAQGNYLEAGASYRQFLHEARLYGLFSTDARFRLGRAMEGAT